MARTKKSETETTPVVETEKTTEVETTDTPVETETTEVVEESKPVEETVQESETLDDKAIIKCEKLAGKKLSLPTRVVEFDENGKCEVTGEEAERLLTIPGYELSK